MKNISIILTAIFLLSLASSCSFEKKYEINGKVIDEKYLLWEFAAKLEEQEYRLQGFNLEQHMQQNHDTLEQKTYDAQNDEHHPQGI